MRRKAHWGRTLAIACIWLGLWQFASMAVGQTLLLPSPAAAFGALMRSIRDSAFWLSVLSSVYRIVLGFVIGVALGTALAVWTSHSAWWRDFFAPLLSIIKATPVASFIVLALVWIKTAGVPIFATVLVVLPAVCANVAQGIQATDPALLEMGRAFGLSRRTMLRTIRWPSVRPYFHAAVTTTMGMAWKAGVAAEVIASPRLSLGGQLYEAKVYLDTPALFATTAVVIALSILLEKGVLLLVRGKGGTNV